MTSIKKQSLKKVVYEFGELFDSDITDTLWTSGEFFRIIILIEKYIKLLSKFRSFYFE